MIQDATSHIIHGLLMHCWSCVDALLMLPWGVATLTLTIFPITAGNTSMIGTCGTNSRWNMKYAIMNIVEALLILCWTSVDALLTICWRSSNTLLTLILKDSDIHFQYIAHKDRQAFDYGSRPLHSRPITHDVLPNIVNTALTLISSVAISSLPIVRRRVANSSIICKCTSISLRLLVMH